MLLHQSLLSALLKKEKGESFGLNFGPTGKIFIFRDDGAEIVVNEIYQERPTAASFKAALVLNIHSCFISQEHISIVHMSL